jgi:CBS domain containing-hemolysin-like protein
MEDIVEELIGEIYDEYDHLPHYITQAGKGWIVGGNAEIARVCDVTGIALAVSPGEQVRTLNEWVIQRLGRPAKGGDVITTDSARLLVRKVRRQLLMEAQLSGSGSDAAVGKND